MSVYKGYKGGPVGYGDPEDKTMADTERGTLFSKFVQERLMTELCVNQWNTWRRCIRDHKDNWIPSRQCKQEFKDIDACQNALILDPDEMKKFEEDYIERRSKFRRTGVGHCYLSKEQLKNMSLEIQNEAKEEK